MKSLLFNGNRNVIHDRLAKRRKALGLTQGMLTARMQVLGVNIDQQAISRIEHNDRIVTDYELACLCKVLRVTATDLTGDPFADED